MRKTTLLPSIIAGCVILGLAGCASMSKGPSDKDLIQNLLNEWKSATEAQDLDKMMACFSNDFRGDEGGKDEMRAFLANFIDSGNLDGAEVDLEKAETIIEGNTASVLSTWLSSTAGSLGVDLDLQKDPDGAWRIVGLDAS
jgi:ketosteroid isomerase-like protein